MPATERARSSPSTLVQMFLLWRHQVATMDRRSFGNIGAEKQHFLRLSIATALEDLKVGLERIARAARDVDGFQSFIKEGKHLC
jgi:bifunctional pyridoxal-dependent enzyme with beta-cystathionase and maltose regulon repressor activities